MVHFEEQPYSSNSFGVSFKRDRDDLYSGFTAETAFLPTLPVLDPDSLELAALSRPFIEGIVETSNAMESKEGEVANCSTTLDETTAQTETAKGCFPYVIRLCADPLSSDGSVSAVAISASSAALFDAGEALPGKRFSSFRDTV